MRRQVEAKWRKLYEEAVQEGWTLWLRGVEADRREQVQHLEKGLAAVAAANEDRRKALFAAVNHEQPRVSEAAVSVLGKVGSRLADPTPLVAPLLEALRDEAGGVRGVAAVALGEVAARLSDPARVVDALLEALKDAEWFVRRTAAAALGEVAARLSDPARVVDALLEALRAKAMAALLWVLMNFTRQHAAANVIRCALSVCRRNHRPRVTG